MRHVLWGRRSPRRDPEKQSRFVEAELSALLQAAGGTLRDEKNDKASSNRRAGRRRTGHAAPAPTPAIATPRGFRQPTPAAAQATVSCEKASAAPARSDRRHSRTVK